MATVGDVYRRIEIRMNEAALDFASGGWTDDERSAEWHGMQAKRQLAYIEALRDALRLIDELQRDN